MDAYIADLQQVCPVEVAEGLLAVDLGSTTTDFLPANRLVRAAAEHVDCLLAFVRYFAASYARDRDARTDSRLLGVMLQVPPDRRSEVADEVRHAIDVMQLKDSNGWAYFSVLRAYDIDLRSRHEARFPPGSVTHFRGLPIYFYSYLADMNDPRGLEELDRAVSASEGDPAQLVGMLFALSELQRADASFIFRRYLEDERRGIGKSGPDTGSKVSTAAKNGLAAVEYHLRNR